MAKIPRFEVRVFIPHASIVLTAHSPAAFRLASGYARHTRRSESAGCASLASRDAFIAYARVDGGIYAFLCRKRQRRGRAQHTDTASVLVLIGRLLRSTDGIRAGG